MLTYLKGKVINKFEDSIILEVNGCFGVKIYVPHPENFQPNTEYIIRTVLIMRENSFNIFGFHTETEVNIFNLLTSIPNISSKISINALSKYSPEDILKIVSNGDFNALKKVIGIGEKNAKKIILYLSEKLKNFSSLTESQKKNSEIYLEAKNALMNLGLPATEAKNLLDKVLESKIKSDNSETLIKEAIKLMKK